MLRSSSKGHDPEIRFQGSKTRSGSLENIWISSLHSCAQGEKDEIRTFRKEGNICGI